MKRESIRLREWQVDCDWCGAQIGQPCHDPKNEIAYFKDVHRPRRRLYDSKYSCKCNDPIDDGLGRCLHCKLGISETLYKPDRMITE